MKYVPLVGRILFVLIFIMSGLNHLFNYGAMKGYAASMGVPLAGVGVIVSGLMIILGGLSVLLGYKVKVGAILLVIFLIPVAFIMHPYWSMEDPQIAGMQQALFMKNISMAGAALLIYYFGTGPLSMDKGKEETL